MMMSEFIDRTGFEPTAKEYAKIEEAYYNFDGDKDAFCKAFVKDGGARKLCKARASEIDRLNSLLMESERQYKKDVADREKRIDELTAELDKELEWKPSDSTGTNMEQKSYEELAKYGKSHQFGDCRLEEAESGVKYDYSMCGDSKLRDMYETLEALKVDIKEREMMLRSMPASGLADPETGEVLFPPARSSKTIIKTTFKKPLQ